MTPPQNTNSTPMNTTPGSAFWLGQIALKLESIETKMTKIEQQEQKISELEKDVLSTKKDVESITSSLEEIKDLIKEPKKTKASWWQVASGIASIGSIILVLAVIVPALNAIQ